MKHKNILIVVLILFVGLIITGSSYAFWTWNSNTTKNVIINTSDNLQDYVVYDEGNSTFSGNFEAVNSYTSGMYSTISLYKTNDAANVDLVATIHMDVKEIGANMTSSNALKWVVTSGTSSNPGSVINTNSFYGVTSGSILTLVPSIPLTTTETFYTIWLWLDASENPSNDLAGETLDTNIWTEITQPEGLEDNFEITRLTTNYSGLYATVVNNKNKITNYAVTNTGSTPSSWENIPTADQANVYNLSYPLSTSGDYFVWFKDSKGNVVSRSTSATIDITPPTGVITSSINLSGLINASIQVSDSGSGPKGTYGWRVSTSSTCDSTIDVGNAFVITSSSSYNYVATEEGVNYICVKIQDNAGNVNYVSDSLTYVTARLLQYDNTNTEVDCDDAQCMIDHIYGMLNP